VVELHSTLPHEHAPEFIAKPSLELQAVRPDEFIGVPSFFITIDEWTFFITIDEKMKAKIPTITFTTSNGEQQFLKNQASSFLFVGVVLPGQRTI
jgi:hypothetical protein